MGKKGKILRVLRSIIKWFFRLTGVSIGILFIVGLIASSYVLIKVKPVVEQAKTKSNTVLMSVTDNTFKKLSNTNIYDNKGNKLMEININNFEYVDIANVSKWVKEGYIAVEDNNFNTHNGVDYKALVRASVALVKNSGGITQGGSTISQQVVKNNLLTQEKTYERKIVEYFLVQELEKEYSKAKIMEFYVNTNFYGDNTYGIETAARYYFDKGAKDLTLAESALFVGLSNNATHYNPRLHPERAKEKRDFVLSRMLETGKITERQYREAKAEPIELKLVREARDKETYQVSYAIYSAALVLMEQEGFKFEYVFDTKEHYDAYKEKYRAMYSTKADEIRQGGYEIHTSLDTQKQADLQTIVDQGLSRYTAVEQDGRYALQGSAVIVNNKTGKVEAIVGGRGVEDEFNRGFLALRQPGSTIKPILSYGMAIDTGEYYPSTVVPDRHVAGGPKNYGGATYGDRTLKEALGRSLNTVPYNLLTNEGVDKGLEYLGKMRFGTLSYLDKHSAATSLGGFTYGVRVVDMAKAYSTVANGGKYRNTECIEKIVHEHEGEKYSGRVSITQVYEPDTAYLLIDMMKAVMSDPYGTARRLKMGGYPVVGKTGTTNDYKDVWFTGTSPKYSVAVWVGYDNPKPLSRDATNLAGDIWARSMRQLHADGDYGTFERPKTIVERNIDNRGNPTNSKTGRVGLFSEILLNKWEVRKKQAEELERVRLEKELYKNTTDLLKGMMAVKVVDIASLGELEGKEQQVRANIKAINDSKDKAELLTELNRVMSTYETTIKRIKEEQERAKRAQAREEEKKRKQRIQGILKDIESTRLQTEGDIRKITQMKIDVSYLTSYLEAKEDKDYYNNRLADVWGKRERDIDRIQERLRRQAERDRQERERQERERIEREREQERLEREEETRYEEETQEQETPPTQDSNVVDEIEDEE